MKHIFLLLYFNAFLTAFACMLLFLFISMKSNKPEIKRLGYLWASLILSLIFIFLNQYGRVNIPDFSSSAVLVFFISGNSATILVLLSIYYLFSLLRDRKGSKWEIIFIALAIVAYIIGFIIINLAVDSMGLKTLYLQYLSVPYNIILLAYLTGNFFLLYKPERKKRLQRDIPITSTELQFVKILYIVMLMYSVADMSTSFLPKSGHLFSFPVTLTIWSCIVFILGSRHLKKLSLMLHSPQISDRFKSKFNITPREAEIIGLLVKGLNKTEIGEKLFIAYKTVDTHTTNIYKKTNAHNILQLLQLVHENK